MKIVELTAARMLARLEEVKNALTVADIKPDLLTLGALIALSERLSASHGVTDRLPAEDEKRLSNGFMSPMPKLQH